MRPHKGNLTGNEWKSPHANEVINQQVPRHKNKKDTKRWCLGKVGREHVAEIQIKDSFDLAKHCYPSLFETRCVKCNKVLQYQYKFNEGYLAPDGSLFAWRRAAWKNQEIRVEFYGPGLPNK